MSSQGLSAPNVTLQKGSTKKSKRRRQIFLRLCVVIPALIFALFPIIWIISAAFNPTSSMASQQLIPPNASTVNFNELLNDPLHPFFLWIWNSVKVAGITTILAVFVCTCSEAP